MSAPNFLAFDIGSKRVGLAVGSVETGTLGRGILLADDPEWKQKLQTMIRDDMIVGFVIGVPLVKSGEVTSSHQTVLDWESKLEQAFGLPIHKVNEAYSSVEAERQLREEGIPTETNKAAIDERAAMLVLEQFLNEV